MPTSWQMMGAIAAMAAGLCPAGTNARYERIELNFEANWGQADPAVKFLARGAGYGVLVTPSETILTVTRRPAAAKGERWTLRKGQRTAQTASVRMKLSGASGGAGVVGVGLLPGKANYFVGQDPSRWRTGVPTYRQVQVKGVYPGVDVVYYGAQRELEFDFVVAPGADPQAIRLSYDGVEDLRVEPNGDLVLRTKLGEIRQQIPVVYQEAGGKRKAVAASHVRLGEREVGFRVREYDRTQPLTIDPRLSYSTLLGGGDAEAAISMAVDSAGSVYVAGVTTSLAFPLTSPYLSTPNPTAVDAFIAKLNATGTALVYSTYLNGGDDTDQIVEALVVNGAGQATIGGSTVSASFPTTPGAFQTTTTDTCCSDGFITRLSANGSSLMYSTYIAGVDAEDVAGLAQDSFGAVYATGETSTTALWPSQTPALQSAHGGGAGDAFALKLNPAGSKLVYATFLGGSGEDRGTGVAVDASGAAYITGWTDSDAYPTTAGAFQPLPGGARDAFLTKLTPAGAAIELSTRLGGDGRDEGAAIALDSQNRPHVAGRTAAVNFPATAGAYQTAHSGGVDVFVARFEASGQALAYATLLGGSGNETAWGIAVDAAGSAYIGGVATADFPVTDDALQNARGGGEDGFLAKLNAAGSALVYSSFLGGAGNDEVDGVAVDASGAVYVAGTTASSDFPTTAGAFQTALQGSSDAFLAKLELDCQNMNYLAIVAGNNQTGTAGRPLASPLIVELRNGCTGPVAGAEVAFASGAATLSAGTVVTGADGRASTTATLGSEAGTVAIEAAAPGVSPVTFTAAARTEESVAVTSSASFAHCAPSPGMIATAWGQGFATRTTIADALPLPTLLDGVIVSVTDSAGDLRNAGLFAVLPGQINFEIPAETQGGAAAVRITGSDGRLQVANVLIESACPGLYSMDASGGGRAAGQALRFSADGALQGASDLSQPIPMGEATDQVILVLYGTGIRGVTGLANVSVRIGEETAEPLYAGPQPTFVGLDQVNVRLPRSVAGLGEIPITLVIDGKAANTVTIQAAPI